MNCRRGATALLLAFFCLCLTSVPALADGAVLTEEETLAAIQAELEADEAARAVPSIPPAAGGMGLAVLLVFGLIACRKHQEQEDEGYDPVLEDHRIVDPYSRLARSQKQRSQYF